MYFGFYDTKNVHIFFATPAYEWSSRSFTEFKVKATFTYVHCTLLRTVIAAVVVSADFDGRLTYVRTYTHVLRCRASPAQSRSVTLRVQTFTYLFEKLTQIFPKCLLSVFSFSISYLEDIKLGWELQSDPHADASCLRFAAANRQ